MSKKSIAYKTVETFSGITQRKLWLKNSENAQTDGHMITAPFKDRWFYEHVEDMLSHVLFKSNQAAQVAFVREYTARVSKVAAKYGGVINPDNFAESISFMLNVLNNHRATSLWGLLYEGSRDSISEMRLESVKAALQSHEGLTPNEAAHASLMTLFQALEAGINPGDGAYERYIPLMEQALGKVRKKSHPAVLVVGKWLITQLVNEFIEEAREQEQNAGGGGAGNEGDESEETPGGGGAGGDSDTKPGEGDQPVSAQERVNALQELAKHLTVPDEQMAKQAATLKRPKWQRRQEKDEAKEEALKAIKANVNNEQEMEELESEGEQEMEELAEEAKQSMRQQMTRDDWLRKSAFAKVVFKDVKAADIDQRYDDWLQSDRTAVKRMRSLFIRMMGKRSSKLEESGDEIDIDAFIEGRMAGELVPCFRHEVRGRGFHMLLLVDRSGSMWGPKTKAVSRAVRIIQQAIKFPFVTFDLWGFQSLADGQVDITRYDPNVTSLDCEKAKVDGCTPLHAAVRLALRTLEDGSDAKQLLLLTDGFPTFYNRKGEMYSTRALMNFVRKDVRKGRQNGVNTTALMIGEVENAVPQPGVTVNVAGQDGENVRGVHFDLSRRQLAGMFGARKNWRQVDPRRLGQDLIEAATASFMDYLRK